MSNLPSMTMTFDVLRSPDLEPEGVHRVSASRDTRRTAIDDPPFALPKSARDLHEQTQGIQGTMRWIRFEMEPSDLVPLERALPCALGGEKGFQSATPLGEAYRSAIITHKAYPRLASATSEAVASSSSHIAFSTRTSGTSAAPRTAASSPTPSKVSSAMARGSTRCPAPNRCFGLN